MERGQRRRVNEGLAAVGATAVLALIGCGDDITEAMDRRTDAQQATDADVLRPIDTAPYRATPCTRIPITSDHYWRRMDLLPWEQAQPVCLNAGSPAGCPAGAVTYGYPGVGWTADLSVIPGAQWIWSNDHIQSATPADGDEVVFSHPVGLVRPGRGRIYLAADDAAVLYVNGLQAGSVGSTTDLAQAGAAQSALAAFDVSGYLKWGINQVQVKATNGPAWFGGCGATGCSYAENPAGVVFGGWIETCPP